MMYHITSVIGQKDEFDCAYQGGGGKKFSFFGKFGVLCFLKHRF